MALTPLLPRYHPEGDFFIPDVYDSLPIKDDTASMEHPFFSLKKQKDTRSLNYENGDVSVKVIPSAGGLPTMFDKDILLYIGSLMMAEINKGNIPPQTIRISIHDYLIATNRKTSIGGGAYERFKQGLVKLRGCTIETTVRTGKTKQVKGFGMLESYGYVESERVKDRYLSVEVKVSDWFYNSIITKEVLTIDSKYFLLRKTLDRRIYEIARKHCGRSKEWKISLEKLLLKTGSTARLAHFRDTTKKLASSNHLPEYLIKFSGEKDIVSFRYRGKPRTKEEQGDLFGDTATPTIPTQIPPDLLDDARHAVGTGLDYYDLWNQYVNWR